MADPTHGDLMRDMGRMEGKQDAMGARLDRLEKIIEDGFAEVRREIAELKAERSERKGMLVALAAIGGLIGTMLTFIGDHLWKGIH